MSKVVFIKCIFVFLKGHKLISNVKLVLRVTLIK